MAVPNVVGMSKPEAESAITSAGLVVGTTSWTSGDTVPEGCVISQSPAAGAVVDFGSNVELTISRYSGDSQTIAVPDVVGMSQSQVQSALTSAGTGKLSVCLWARWNGQPAVAQGLIAKRNNWGDGSTMWSLEADINTGKLGFFHEASTPFSGDPVLPIGEWTHVAVSFDGTTATFYVDGEPTGSGPFSFPSSTQAAVVFGASEPDGDNPFNGALDDIRFYDQGLSQRQILAAMAGLDIVLPTESKDIRSRREAARTR